jgi:putative aminopeptidase FrvX
VSLYSDTTIHRGTILPLLASGHTFNEAVDTQPVGWDNVELRIDADIHCAADARALGIQIGDFIGIDANAEFLDNGFLNARHLDDKAGVASLLAAAKAIHESSMELPVECHLLFTISEETGSGASAVLHGDVAEMVSIDNGTVAKGQNSAETGATIAMGDSTGPFDYHLTHWLLGLCRQYDIAHQRDIFRHYRCDSASAIEAGNDIRTALITFGVDASHGYERTRMDALLSIARLCVAYAASGLVHQRQAAPLGDLSDFPKVRTTPVPLTVVEQSENHSQVPPEEP